MGQETPQWQDSLVIVELALFVGACGLQGVYLWTFMHLSCSLFFISVSLVAGTHHHNEIWHEGDYHEGKDFGLMQLEAV